MEIALLANQFSKKLYHFSRASLNQAEYITVRLLRRYMPMGQANPYAITYKAMQDMGEECARIIMCVNEHTCYDN